MNQQDHPHREGQQNNTTPQVEGTGQRTTTNNTQQLSDIGGGNSTEALKDQTEGRVQQDERQP